MTTGHRSYYHSHPRGFANECVIRSATTPEGRRQCRGMRPMSRDEMRQHVAWLNGEAEGWGSGNAGSTYSAISVEHGCYDVERGEPGYGPCPTCGKYHQ